MITHGSGATFCFAFTCAPAWTSTTTTLSRSAISRRAEVGELGFLCGCFRYALQLVITMAPDVYQHVCVTMRAHIRDPSHTIRDHIAARQLSGDLLLLAKLILLKKVS
jgi:hypothetical protein